MSHFSDYGVLGPRPSSSPSDSEDDSSSVTYKKSRLLETPKRDFLKSFDNGLLTPPSTDECEIYKFSSQSLDHVHCKLFTGEFTEREWNY